MRHKLTEEDLQIIRQEYPTTGCRALADRIGAAHSTIYQLAARMGIKKDLEWIRENSRQNFGPDHPGRRTMFKTGQEPANKGKKITEYMTEEAIQKLQQTTFKPGHTPHNHQPVGTEIVVEDGYVKVKVAEPKQWKWKHRMVWEAHNGNIPTGHIIQFKDGNRQNCDINNLYLISRQVQLKEQNSMYARYPEEVVANIKALGSLTRSINKSKRNNNEQE